MNFLFLFLFLFISCQDSSVLEPGELREASTVDSETIATYDEESAPYGSYLTNDLSITEAFSAIQEKTILNPLILNDAAVKVGDSLAIAIGKLQAQIDGAGTVSSAIKSRDFTPTNYPLINSFGLYSGEDNSDLAIAFSDKSEINFLVGEDLLATISEEKIEFFSDVFTNGQVFSLSDKSAKTKIRSLENARDLLKINGVSFNWKESDKKDFGLIAQDVESYFPEAVQLDENGKRRVSYAKLIAPLIEVVKKQQQEIDKLKKAVAKKYP